VILKYGLHEEGIKYIDDVDSGLSCGCRCMSCGEELIARNGGEFNEHHFAHRNRNVCGGIKLDVSTYLLKEALEEAKELLLPKSYIKIDSCDSKLLIEDERLVKINKIIELNKNIIRVLTDEYIEIIILVRLKRGKFKIDFDLTNKDAIEVVIDASSIGTKEDIVKQLLINQLKISWLNNKYEEYQRERLILLLERKRFVLIDKIKFVKNCPLRIDSSKNEGYAKLEQDCFSCKYFLCEDKLNDIIYCLGKAKIFNLKDLEKIEEVERNDDLTVVTYLDGTVETLSINPTPATNLLNLWIENKNKPFLARNIETNIAVFIKKDPQKQHNKYSKCYGWVYKNGHLLGDREIYGYLLDQWLIIPNKKRKDNINKF
jgi:hypothetical protein